MQMKYLTVECFPKRHKEAASSILAVVNDNDTLEHVVMKTFGHAIKCSHIKIKSTDNIEIASYAKICCKCQISGVITD